MTDEKIQSRFSELSFITSAKDIQERAVLLIHATNLESGLKCTGLNEEDPVYTGGSLPKEWNQHSGDIYGFRYSLSEQGKSDVILLKILRSPTGIEINAASQNHNEQLHSAEIKLDGLDFANQPRETMTKIINQYKEAILKGLLPKKESGSSYSPFPSMVSPPYGSHLRQDRGPSGPLNPFGIGVGSRDLDPFGIHPFGPMSINGPGGSSLMGPDHPFFAGDPGLRRPDMGGQFPRPPGARYDPTGPFGSFPDYY